VVLAVLDNSRSWDDEDEAILDATRQKLCIFLINKADLANQLVVDERVRAVAIRTSAITGEGLAALKSAIVRHADFAGDDGVMILRERQRLALDATAVAVDHAIESFNAGRPPDVIAVDIMTALDHLGEIVGATSVEAVLERIFSEFCIGK